MFLQLTSLTLTLTGLFFWFSGVNQGLGYGIFLAGGVMWLILQRAEKKRKESAKDQLVSPSVREPVHPSKPKPRRQSDFTG